MITLIAKTASAGFPSLKENKVLSCHLVELSQTDSSTNANGEVRDSIWSEPTPQVVIGLKTVIGTYYDRLSLVSYLKASDIDEDYLAKNPEVELIAEKDGKAIRPDDPEAENVTFYVATLDKKIGKYIRHIAMGIEENIVDGKIVKDALPAYKMLSRLAKIATKFSGDVDIQEANNLICDKDANGVFSLTEDKKFYATFGPDKRNSGRTQILGYPYSVEVYLKKKEDALAGVSTPVDSELED